MANNSNSIREYYDTIKNYIKNNHTISWRINAIVFNNNTISTNDDNLFQNADYVTPLFSVNNDIFNVLHSYEIKNEEDNITIFILCNLNLYKL